VKLSKIKLLLICLSLGLGHYVFAQTPNAAKDIRVGGQPWSVPTTQGPVTAFQSLNVDSRFYIAPEFRFIAVNTKGDVAKTGISHADKTSILMNLQLMIPAVNAEVTQYLSKQIGQTVSVGHLAVYAIVVDLMEEFFQEKYGLENAYKIEQPTFTKTLPVTFLVNRAKADEFIRDVNSGKVTFRLTYAFNQINIDSHYAELSARLIRDTDQIRHLDQQGKELMTAEQMAEVTTKIRNQITSKEILSLGGKIEPRSIPIEKLMVLFEVGDLMKKTEAQLADFERRLYKQLDLKVDPKDFQPFRVQKHVIESLNSSRDVAEQRQNYSRDYNREKKKFSASVSGSASFFGGWGFGKVRASSHYAREAEKVTDRRAMSDEAFRDFVAKSHGVEYDTEERLFRGVKIYDTQKIKALGDLKVVSVTVKPTLTSGVKRLDLVPKSPIYGEAAITVSRDGNVGIGTANPKAKLEVNGEIRGEMPYYFTGALATPTEWMADVIFNSNYKRFCEAIGRTFVRAEELQGHYQYIKSGFFYVNWYYAGKRFCDSDTHVWGNTSPSSDYAVWKYSGKCGCCISRSDYTWTFERSAIIWCK